MVIILRNFLIVNRLFGINFACSVKKRGAVVMADERRHFGLLQKITKDNPKVGDRPPEIME